ncbi:MAG: hypothetical protein K5837_04295 [Candidatus Saccharibacteria bacterium]|nr:hypothetical protein [Candidatus Saccharibacteria bacterium]
MDVNAKYRRWGWGAVIGLIGVILIAGLIVAISMSSSPKPNTTNESIASTGNNGSNNTNDGSIGDKIDSDGQSDAEKEAQQKAEEEKKAKAEAEKKAAEEKVAREKAEREAAEKAAQEKAEREAAQKSNNLPHTGPVDSLVSVVAFAVIAYLVALNVSFVKKQSV